MKINNKYLIYTILIAMMVLFEFFPSNTSQQTKPMDLDLPKEDIRLSKWSKIYDDKLPYNKLWGIQKKNSRGGNDANESNSINITLDKKSKKLCLEDDCFRLLGFHDVNGTNYVSLYNTKTKMKDYKVGQTLSLSVVVKEIKKNTIDFMDTNTSNVWTIKLFDVNKTKYKPKEYNASN